MNIHVILAAHRCHICKIIYLLICVCNLANDPHGAFPEFSDLLRMVQSQLPEAPVPISRFSPHVVNRCCFHSLVSALLFAFFLAFYL